MLLPSPHKNREQKWHAKVVLITQTFRYIYYGQPVWQNIISDSKFEIVYHLLCISTSEQVLCMPFAD